MTFDTILPIMEIHVIKNFFFFQAEDGIRDVAVTGVQTCALPIWLFRNTWFDHGTAIHWFPRACNTTSTKSRSQVKITMNRKIVHAVDLYGVDIMSIWSFANPFWTSLSCASLVCWPFRMASIFSFRHADMTFCVRAIFTQFV